MSKLTVLIPTAGLGTRLGNLTKKFNKSLIDINYKPVISHIIESFPKKTTFVIALGYEGELVKQYLKIAHDDINFKFVKVKYFKGNKSGLGRSLYDAKHLLQKPFFFVPCDTIPKKIKYFQKQNIIYYKKVNNNGNYRSISILKNNLSKVFEKNKLKKKINAYSGILKIHNYKAFWRNADIHNRKFLKQGETFLINKMLSQKIRIKSKKISWLDTGNLESLNKINGRNTNLNILPKEHEKIYFVDNKVIKYFEDKKIVKNRVLRSKKLVNFVPKIIKANENFYLYRKINYKVFSNKISLKNFKQLLEFSKKFWKIKKLNNTQYENFKKNCKIFYKDKTYMRIKQFISKYDFKFDNYDINNKKIDKINYLLKKIDWNYLAKGQACRFHGDFHFENILFNQKKFILLDWRQEFQGNTTYGDIYYDLSKLMHGILVPHYSVSKNLFKISKTKKKFLISIKKDPKLLNIEKYYKRWLKINNFSYKKVMILTGLIYLNISPLHHYPYSHFLYLYGKLIISNELNDYGET